MREGVGAIFGDERLERRARLLVEALVEQPEVSLPQACADWAAQRAAYRFFDNAGVEPSVLSAALGRATAARCVGEARVLVVQDTTSLDYTRHRATTNLGVLEHAQSRGILLHSCLAVSEDGVPLGLLDVQPWVREPDREAGVAAHDDRRHTVPVEGKESGRWLRGLRRAVERLGAGTRTLTVADREADVYELFLLAHELEGDWLIRARHDRALADAEARLIATVASAPVAAELPLAVPRNGAQAPRTATVQVRRATVVLVPPRQHPRLVAQWWAEHPTAERLGAQQVVPLRVGVVLVTEVAAPDAVTPLRWLLLTTLPVTTVDEALACIRLYRLRWLIEQFHFVLKSGCRVERLQLQDGQRLQRALVLYAGVAWWLLWLTEVARASPRAPCTVAFDTPAWQVLVATTSRTLVLPPDPPDLHTAVRLLASLGGFKGRASDADPGVQTLWRGLRRLNDRLATWLLFHPPSPSPSPRP
jgi:Transposase DNA-binding/Transposase DDE domain